MSANRPPTREELIAAFNRLCSYAKVLISMGREAFHGITSEELVNETFLRFFISPSGLGWDSTRDLGNYLCGVMKNMSREMRRDRWQRARVSIDEVPAEKLSVQDSGGLEANVFVEQVQTAVAGEESLEELVLAALSIHPDGRNSNQRLAAATGWSVKDVEKTKKRLKRRLKKKMGVALAEKIERNAG